LPRISCHRYCFVFLADRSKRWRSYVTLIGGFCFGEKKKYFLHFLVLPAFGSGDRNNGSGVRASSSDATRNRNSYFRIKKDFCSTRLVRQCDFRVTQRIMYITMFMFPRRNTVNVRFFRVRFSNLKSSKPDISTKVKITSVIYFGQFRFSVESYNSIANYFSWNRIFRGKKVSLLPSRTEQSADPFQRILADTSNVRQNIFSNRFVVCSLRLCT